jgi:GlpG protein
MSTLRAIETDLGIAMAGFSRHLWARRIAHRVLEESGRQFIVVDGDEVAQLVLAELRKWHDGELALESDYGGVRHVAERVLSALLHAPATMLLVVLSGIGCALHAYDLKLTVLHWFTFTDVQRVGANVVFAGVRESYATGQYWRIITPVFMHFGILHFVFNSIWVWEFGRRVESVRGTPTLLGIALLTGAAGNIAQYIAAGTLSLGGISGVIYGLLGYMLCWSRFTGDARLAVPAPLVVFMVCWLLVTLTPFGESLGTAPLGGAMHAAGLLLGLLLGAGAALLYSPPAQAS